MYIQETIFFYLEYIFKTIFKTTYLKQNSPIGFHERRTQNEETFHNILYQGILRSSHPFMKAVQGFSIYLLVAGHI